MNKGFFLATVLVPIGVAAQLSSQLGSEYVALATTNKDSETRFKCKKVIGNWRTQSAVPSRDVVLSYSSFAGAFKKNSVWVTLQKPASGSGPKPPPDPYIPVTLKLKGVKESVTVYAMKADKFCVINCGVVKGKHRLVVMGKITMVKDLKTSAKTFGDEFLAPFFASSVQYQ
ncbi:MAG TPA: hypothetical protein VK171_09665 [Fimbriimonas sp.]|nr:hypothetical protein [Fimbriimonas sp.]